jgi:hypothetical protein
VLRPGDVGHVLAVFVQEVLVPDEPRQDEEDNESSSDLEERAPEAPLAFGFFSRGAFGSLGSFFARQGARAFSDVRFPAMDIRSRARPPRNAGAGV